MISFSTKFSVLTLLLLAVMSVHDRLLVIRGRPRTVWPLTYIIYCTGSPVSYRFTASTEYGRNPYTVRSKALCRTEYLSTVDFRRESYMSTKPQVLKVYKQDCRVTE
jgi:hypothetical protein